MEPQTVILWFRNDLRVQDHPALSAARKSAQRVIGLYVLDDAAAGAWKMGGASRWWLHHSLAALRGSLRDHGVPLMVRSGDTIQIVGEVAREHDVRTVSCSRAFEPWAAAQEKALHEALGAEDISLKRYSGALLHDPDQLKTKTGGSYKVYTPFWRSLSKEPMRRLAEEAKSPANEPLAFDSDHPDLLGLLPTKPDWAGGLRETWTPGEAGARAALDRFLAGAANDYPEARDMPGVQGTSRLSPHLHFGEISPAMCWHATQTAMEAGRVQRGAGEKFLKEIAWREFSYHLLHHHPALPHEAFRPEFSEFPWEPVGSGLERWQKGETGYPIVDAGMRELWHTGWMHNRVRMIAASFLIKHLLVPWQDGEAWFWDTLVDADLASNAASWQWVAGSGADAAPYFRIFNPVLQGEKFDADGTYVRRWVPELARLPDKVIHKPWTASSGQLADAGIALGTTLSASDRGPSRGARGGAQSLRSG